MKLARHAVKVDVLVNEPAFSQRLVKKNITRLKTLAKLWISKILIIKRAFDLEYGTLYGMVTFWGWGYITLYGTLSDLLLLMSFLLLSTAMLTMTVSGRARCLRA